MTTLPPAPPLPKKDVKNTKPEYYIDYSFQLPELENVVALTEIEKVTTGVSQWKDISVQNRIASASCESTKGVHYDQEIPILENIVQNKETKKELTLYKKHALQLGLNAAEAVNSFTDFSSGSSHEVTSTEVKSSSYNNSVTTNLYSLDSSHASISSKQFQINANNWNQLTDTYLMESKFSFRRSEGQDTAMSSTRIRYTDKVAESYFARELNYAGGRYMYSDNLVMQVGHPNGMTLHPSGKEDPEIQNFYGKASLLAAKDIRLAAHNSVAMESKGSVGAIAEENILLHCKKKIEICSDEEVVIKTKLLRLECLGIVQSGQMTFINSTTPIIIDCQVDVTLDFEEVKQMEKELPTNPKTQLPQTVNAKAVEKLGMVVPLPPVGTAGPTTGKSPASTYGENPKLSTDEQPPAPSQATDNDLS